MHSYKTLLPQPCSWYSQTESKELDRNVQLQVLIASVLQLVTHRQRVELDRNAQLQVLIASVLQSVLTDREKNQIGMHSYKFLLPQPYSWYSQTESRTRQECGATSPYCLSPTVGTHRQREELDSNAQLQVLDCLSPAVGTHRQGRRTKQECGATSPYCLSPTVGTHRQRVELDRNVQLQFLIASVLQSVVTDREKNQIVMRSYKSLIASVLQWVLKDGKKNQIGMRSYKSLLPQPCSWYSKTEKKNHIGMCSQKS